MKKRKKNDIDINYITFDENISLVCDFLGKEIKNIQTNEGEKYKRTSLNLKNCRSEPFYEEKGDGINYLFDAMEIIYEQHTKNKDKKSKKCPKLTHRLKKIGKKRQNIYNKDKNYLIQFNGEGTTLYCDYNEKNERKRDIVIERISSDIASDETDFIRAKEVNLVLSNCERIPIRIGDDNFIIDNIEINYLPYQRVINVDDPNISIEEKIKMIKARTDTWNKQLNEEKSIDRRLKIKEQIDKDNEVLSILEKRKK